MTSFASSCLAISSAWRGLPAVRSQSHSAKRSTFGASPKSERESSSISWAVRPVSSIRVERWSKVATPRAGFSPRLTHTVDTTAIARSAAPPHARDRLYADGASPTASRHVDQRLTGRKLCVPPDEARAREKAQREPHRFGLVLGRETTDDRQASDDLGGASGAHQRIDAQ